jgi:hypothetical protein
MSSAMAPVHRCHKIIPGVVNFDCPTFLDFLLAEFVLSRLPHELKLLVNNFQLMQKEPFVYGNFKICVQTFYNGLP